MPIDAILRTEMPDPSHAAGGVPAGTLKVTASELPPPHTPEHDEWLLDEALIETFPASDPIAVSLSVAHGPGSTVGTVRPMHKRPAGPHAPCRATRMRSGMI